MNALNVDRKAERRVNILADAEAEASGERMKKTLAETQRGATFFMLKLLLGLTLVFELSKGQFGVSSALAAALALVWYQSNAENANEGEP